MLKRLKIITFLFSVLSLVLSLSLPSMSYAADPLVKLDMDRVDLPGFIQAAGKLLNKNIVLDKQVSGEVTIQSNKGFTIPQIQLLYESVLEMNRLTEIQGDGFTKVVPRTSALGRALPIKGEGKGYSMSTAIITLHYLSAVKAKLVVSPFLSQDGVISVVAGLDLLVITDTGVTINKIMHILKSIDTEAGTDIRIVQLENSNPLAITTSIQSVFLNKELRAVPYGSLNSVLITGPPTTVAKALRVISRLDRLERLHVSRVEVVSLQENKAAAVITILKKLPSISKKLEMAMDEKRDAIILVGSPADRAIVRRVISDVDTPRKQILIKAIIAEVSGDNTLSLGIDWKTSNSSGFAGGVGAGNVSAVNAIADTTKTLVLGLFTGTPISFGVIIKALEKDSNANILSVPTITTLNNETAELSVGQNVPFVTGQQATSGGVANPFQTIERKDVGLLLKITPRIVSGNRIVMDIYQEVSSIATSSSIATDIVTNKRSLKTVAVARSGTTLVIGGLLQRDDQTVDSKVPGLGDIPVLGSLFTNRSKTLKKTNLMVFIHPMILEDTSYSEMHLRNTKRLFPNEDGFIFLPEE